MDVCGNGGVTNPLVVVPINGETAIEGSSPVYLDSIDLIERLDEMVRRVFADVLDTKIVEHKGESDVFGVILPKVRVLSDGGVAKLNKVNIEPIFRNAAGLFQA